MNMSAENILVILVVGIAAGWLAGKVVRGTGFGLVGDLLIGIAGALFAGLLLPRLGLNLGGGILSQILFAALGAIILLLFVGLVRGRRA
ncbi:MAG: GlsB/YeaQ/YmgE family stress response membrane protein [Reyranella sp.]